VQSGAYRARVRAPITLDRLVQQLVDLFSTEPHEISFCESRWKRTLFWDTDERTFLEGNSSKLSEAQLQTSTQGM
jgi:hypothetical protein